MRVWISNFGVASLTNLNEIFFLLINTLTDLTNMNYGKDDIEIRAYIRLAKQAFQMLSKVRSKQKN